MNRQTTALIFILSLLAVFVSNTMAADPEATTKPSAGGEQKPTDPPPTAAATQVAVEVQTEPPAPVEEASGNGAEASTTGSACMAYSAFGTLATALLANFF